MAKVETTLTLEQLDAALKLNGSLRAFDAGYAKGFAAGLAAGAEMAETGAKLNEPDGERYTFVQTIERSARQRWLSSFATALRERAREERAKDHA